ncbi:MAG TPA: TIGR02466 family protein [Steroidobacteraceae bacterium]|nr:TIGR02466 family protein [Steroidobacteraceae bacterium]HRX90498.1 TIGR02466 family protein [Steroidobacteraceae bacterium]
MSVRAYFATRIYTAKLTRSNWRAFNQQLLRQCEQIRQDDRAGIKWSRANYPSGFTSYGSMDKLHQWAPAFEKLERRIRPHVRKFADALEFEHSERQLAMTDCWVNIMGQHAVHGLHLHPHATISGTYYVRAGTNAPGLKFEDPRLDRYMAAPPRSTPCRVENQTWVTIPAEAGQLVLFESWLRHEVPANPSRAERVSISFNYGWF